MVIKRVKATIEKLSLYIFNTSWILAEKSLNLVLGFLVTAAIARHLGPETFGVISYAASFIAILASFGHMGLSGLIVKELVNKPEQEKLILGTAATLKAVGIVVGLLVVLLVSFFLQESKKEFFVISIVAFSVLFKPIEVANFWFESKVKAKFIAIANIASLTIAAIFRLTLVAIGAGVLLFATAYALQAAVFAVLILCFLQLVSKHHLFHWQFSWSYGKELLKDGWMIFAGAMLSVLYFKVDQVMLKWISGSEAVGVYAVAATLSEVWYFIPIAIVASLFPRLIKLKAADEQLYNRRYQQIFDFLFVVAFLISIVFTIFSDQIVHILFGSEYAEASAVLVVHIWASVFIFMRAAFSKWILIENVYIFSLVTQLAGAVSNILLNILLIPEFDIMGAAYATIISYAIASYVSLFIFKRTRVVFWMMTKSLFSPIVYPYLLLSRKL